MSIYSLSYQRLPRKIISILSQFPFSIENRFQLQLLTKLAIISSFISKNKVAYNLFHMDLNHTTTVSTELEIFHNKKLLSLSICSNK